MCGGAGVAADCIGNQLLSPIGMRGSCLKREAILSTKPCCLEGPPAAAIVMEWRFECELWQCSNSSLLCRPHIPKGRAHLDAQLDLNQRLVFPTQRQSASFSVRRRHAWHTCTAGVVAVHGSDCR